jgi:hypothetical protein
VPIDAFNGAQAYCSLGAIVKFFRIQGVCLSTVQIRENSGAEFEAPTFWRSPSLYIRKRVDDMRSFSAWESPCSPLGHHNEQIALSLRAMKYAGVVWDSVLHNVKHGEKEKPTLSDRLFDIGSLRITS